MSIEYNPVGITCNLGCAYCYQTPMRDAGNLNKERDFEKVKKALIEEGGQFTTFGGEALLAPLDHLEEVWKFGFETYGSNGLQTNGVLINDDHIELFKKYNVMVGISLDGPDELNDSRWRGNLKTTRKSTQKTLNNIDKLLDHGITPSLIITLYQGNARGKRLNKLKKWIKSLDEKGIRHVRLHLLEVEYDNVRETMALTDEENYNALIEFHDLEYELKNMSFDIFGDIRRLMRGDDRNVTCIWNACDPYTTRAVRGVDANGDQHNCGRTNKQGVNWHKASKPGHERQISLYHTPWELNGCKGCRFFIMCKGQCPGTGENYDWRNKSDSCWVWYKLMEYIEERMLEEGEMPLSLNPERLEIESHMLQEWGAGRSSYIHYAREYIRSQKQSQGVIPYKTKDNHSDSHGDGYSVEHIYDHHGDDHADSAIDKQDYHQDTWK